MKSKSLTNESGEVRELTSKEIRGMGSAQEILPPTLYHILPKRKRGERGLQKQPTKIAVTLRYSPEVIEYFKATGAGWQTRMDEILKKWIEKHPHAA